MSMIGSQPTESQPTQVQPTDLGPWSLVQMFIALLGGDFFLAGLAGSVHDIDLDSLCADQQWKSIGLTSNDCSLAGGSLDCSGSFVCGDTVCNLTGPLDVTSGLVTTHDGAATLFACTYPGPDWTFTDTTTGDVVSGPEGGSVLVKVDGVAVTGSVVEGQTVTVGPTTATVVAVDTPTGPATVSGEVTVSAGSVMVGGSDAPFAWQVSTEPSEFDGVAEVVTDPAVHGQLTDFSRAWGISEPQQAAFGLGQLTGWILNGSRTMDRLDAELDQELTSHGFVGEEKQKARDTRQQALSLIFGASILKLQTMGTVPTTTTQPTQAPPRTGPGQTQAEAPSPGDGQEQPQEAPKSPVGQTVAAPAPQEEPLHPDETAWGEKWKDTLAVLISVIPASLVLKGLRGIAAAARLIRAGKGTQAAGHASEAASAAAKAATEAAKAARKAGKTAAAEAAEQAAREAESAAQGASIAREAAEKAEKAAKYPSDAYGHQVFAQDKALTASDRANKALLAAEAAAEAVKPPLLMRWGALGLEVISIGAAMRFGENLGHRIGDWASK